MHTWLNLEPIKTYLSVLYYNYNIILILSKSHIRKGNLTERKNNDN